MPGDGKTKKLFMYEILEYVKIQRLGNLMLSCYVSESILNFHTFHRWLNTLHYSVFERPDKYFLLYSIEGFRQSFYIISAIFIVFWCAFYCI